MKLKKLSGSAFHSSYSKISACRNQEFFTDYIYISIPCAISCLSRDHFPLQISSSPWIPYQKPFPESHWGYKDKWNEGISFKIQHRRSLLYFFITRTSFHFITEGTSLDLIFCLSAWSLYLLCSTVEMRLKNSFRNQKRLQVSKELI